MSKRDDIGNTQETGVEATHLIERGSDPTYASATDKTKCQRGCDGGTPGGNAGSKDLCAAEVGGAGGSVTQPDCEETTFAAAAVPITGMNESTCFWCGNEGHIKTRCLDYQNCLANRMIHFQGAHPRTRLGLQGCGGPIVPLPKESGLWQQVWVNRERRKPESAMQQQGCIVEVTEVIMGPEMTPGGKLRQLSFEEMKTYPQTPFIGALTVGPPQLNLRPREVRAYVVQESEDGVIQGWVEVKRLVEEMEDSITVAERDVMGKRQAREVSYPQAGGRSETPEDEEMMAEVSPEPAGTAQNSPEPQDDENNSESEEEQPQPEKTRRARKTGVQQGTKVPIKLRVEAQLESIVDKILDQLLDRITVGELLGLSPDLLHEIWGILRLPPLNKTTIPSTQVADIGIGATVATTSVEGPESLQGVRVEVRPIRGLKELYACASPTVMGKIESKLKVKMLIDSDSEMCVMSRDLYERAKGLLPVDTEMHWSIGLANSTMDKVFGFATRWQ